MQCPACKEVNLSMADRQGIEIDYGPQCPGIWLWLDRGELDRLIERAERAMPQPPNTAPGSREDRCPERAWRPLPRRAIPQAAQVLSWANCSIFD